jgi:hypothetical protein
MEQQTGPAGVGPGDDGTVGPRGAPVSAEPEPPADDGAVRPGGAVASAEPEPAAAADATEHVHPAAAQHVATGDTRVDAALTLLDRLPGLPVAEHPNLFEQVHAQLSDVLGELDPGSAGTSG